MSYLKQISLFAVIVIASLASSVSEAGVVIDDFSDMANAAGDVSGIDRISFGGGGPIFLADDGFLFLNPGKIQYTATGSDFGTVVPEISNGFTVGANSGSGTYDLTIRLFSFALNNVSPHEFYNETQSISGNQLVSFSNANLGAARRIQFEVSNLSSNAVALFGGSRADGQAFTAVPEPTSLMLVGMAVAGVMIPRRRRS